MKYGGILEGYPRIRERFGQIADYLALVRPFTLLPPFLVGIFGSLLTVQSGAVASIWTIIYISLTLALCQAVGQCINQAVGAEEDLINKPYRPIPSGRIGVKEAYGLGFLLFLFAIGRAFTVNVSFGLGILVLLFFAVFYNLKPIEARKHLGLNLLWMSLSRGLLPLLVIWSAYADPFVAKPWVLGSIAFLWVVAFQPTKDLPDVEGDTQLDLPTLPVVYGVRKTYKWIKWVSFTPFVLLTGYLVYGVLPVAYGLLYLLLVMREIGVRGLSRKINNMENNLGWLMFYLGLGFIYVLSWLAEMI